MIERFNFYDLYGYLIPGILFLIIVLAPFGISSNDLRLDLLSAAVGVVVGYISGHMIQFMARVAFPSDHPRFPSDRLLDDEDHTFSPELKREISFRILRDFNINVNASTAYPQDIISQRRKDAFMLCRIRLLQTQKGTYAEQFQGLYALMRGVAASCTLGAAYFSGYFVLALEIFGAGWYVMLVIGIMALVAITILEVQELIDKITGNPKLASLSEKLAHLRVSGTLFWLVALLLFSSPLLVASSVPEWLKSPQLSFLIVLGLLFVTLRCIRAYRFYAEQFAITVYRDFGAS